MPGKDSLFSLEDQEGLHRAVPFKLGLGRLSRMSAPGEVPARNSTAIGQSTKRKAWLRGSWHWGQGGGQTCQDLLQNGRVRL